jgi:hypothetical protein
MQSKSLVIRTKNWLSHLLLQNVACDEINCDENYGIGDVLKDCVGLSFVTFFILVIFCGLFNLPTLSVSLANIIPVVLLVDYLRRKDVPKIGKFVAILSLAANIYLAISLATNRWDWCVGLLK